MIRRLLCWLRGHKRIAHCESGYVQCERCKAYLGGVEDLGEGWYSIPPTNPWTPIEGLKTGTPDPLPPVLPGIKRATKCP